MRVWKTLNEAYVEVEGNEMKSETKQKHANGNVEAIHQSSGENFKRSKPLMHSQLIHEHLLVCKFLDKIYTMLHWEHKTEKKECLSSSAQKVNKLLY